MQSDIKILLIPLTKNQIKNTKPDTRKKQDIILIDD